MARLYSGVGSRRCHSCVCRTARHERRLHAPSGPTCHQCSRVGPGQRVNKHTRHCGRYDDSLVTFRHRQRPIRSRIRRQPWTDQVPALVSKQTIDTKAPTEDDVTIMYQLLSRLSLGEAPAVLEHEYTMSTTEPEEDHLSDPDDRVINVVRLSQPNFGLDPAAIMTQTLILREIWSRFQQSLQATLPSSTALSPQPEGLALSFPLNTLPEKLRTISQQLTTRNSEGLATPPENALLVYRFWKVLEKRLSVSSAQLAAG